ncbi:MAG: helicase-related protein [Nitrososphaeraceae archaeon]
MNSSPIELSPLQYVEHPLVWNRCLELRSYQKAISQSCCYRNTLVILPTSLGKTIVALLVCANMLYKYKDMRVLVMAPTRPLVSQHMMSFLSALKVLQEETACVTGKTLPEYRSAVWNQRRIRLLFATPEVVKNDISERRLSLSDFSLLVFDEAHRAVKDYAYTSIARHYIEQSSNPLLLALTASPGAERKRVQEVCDNLFVENMEYRTEEDPDVKPYVNPIDVKWEWFNLPEEYMYVISLLRSVLDEKLKWLIQRGIVTKNRIDWIFKRDLIQAGDLLRYNLELTMEEQRGPIYIALSNQSAALSLMYCIELMGSQGSYSLKAFLDRAEKDDSKTQSFLRRDPRILEAKALISGIQKEHPKVKRVLELVKQHLQSSVNGPEESRSRILIFTQYRDTARHITDILSKSSIRSSRFVGQAKRQGDEGMRQEEQATVLELFRNGEFNVLVATSIAEEGLDIPEVDLVIFYEPIPSEIRYIQRKGRTGRKSAGSVIILAANETVDRRYHLASQRRIEMMHKRLSNITNITLKQMNRLPFKPNLMTSEELSVIENRQARLQQNLTKRIELEIKDSKSPDGDDARRGHLSRLQTRSRQISSVLEADLVTGKLRRGVQRAVRLIYLQLVKAGKHGIDADELRDNLRLENLVLVEAIKKLEKLKKIEWLDDGRLTTAESLKQYPGKIYNVYVEKILPGKALVTIDERWHARLNQYDYDGPRDLLKTGSEFRAVGDLYHERGILTIRIKQVLFEK